MWVTTDRKAGGLAWIIGLAAATTVVAGCGAPDPGTPASVTVAAPTPAPEPPTAPAAAAQDAHGEEVAVEIVRWASGELLEGFEDQLCARSTCTVRIPDVDGTLTLLQGQGYDPLGYLAVALQLRALGGLEGKAALDIGTGAGPLAALALAAGARKVVATDIQPSAVRGARDNLHRLGWRDRADVRQVSIDDPGAYAVIRDDERFDLILANPPTADREPASLDEYIQSDPGWVFLRSIVRGAPDHLTEDGRLWIAFNVPAGLRAIRELAAELELDATIQFDDRRERLDEHVIRPTVEDYAAELTPIVELRRRSARGAATQHPRPGS